MTLSTGLLQTGIALPPMYHCWFLGCRRHLTAKHQPRAACCASADALVRLRLDLNRSNSEPQISGKALQRTSGDSRTQCKCDSKNAGLYQPYYGELMVLRQLARMHNPHSSRTQSDSLSPQSRLSEWQARL